MNKYKNFLKQVAEDFHVEQGKTETSENFKARIIYSAICRLSYASLWDNSADSTISVRHFKDKIDELLKIYLELYPEVKISENLSEEIYDLYLKTGNFYHKSHRISAPIFSVAEQKNIMFMRGVTPSQKIFMSGAGVYLPESCKILSDKAKFTDFVEMFVLHNKNLLDFWNEIIYYADWNETEILDDAEFLKMSPPFNSGYWQKSPMLDGRVSIVRNGQYEPKNYYLYKFEGRSFLCSRLPNWLTYDEFFADVNDYCSFRGGVYRQVSCACLANYEILPSIKFKVDGSIVKTRFEYLPPPTELYLSMLYSWAKNLEILPDNFNRIFDTEIFFVIKEVLEKIGYTFMEE